MSEVRVNKLSPRSGTNVQLGDSGDTITVPSGATLDASNATTTLPANVVTTTGTQTLTNKTIDASQLNGTITPSDNTVTPAKLNYNYNQYRNIIINGDMSIAQRGTSQASAGTPAGAYDTVDRFLFAEQLGTFTMSQETDVPSGQGFAKSLKFDCTTADASPSSNAYLLLQQRVEGQNLQYLKKGTANAESVTMSFWVKSNKTGTYILELDDNDNARNINKSYTISSANTWEKKTITFAGDTTGAFDNDNGRSLNVLFWLGAGTDYTSGTLNNAWESTTNANRAVGQVNLADSTANYINITGVQLEAGQTASEFEFLPYDVNLQRCLRYYHLIDDGDNTSGFAMASSYSASTAYAVVPLNPEMRTTPSIDQVSGTAYYSYLNEGTGKTFDSFALSVSSTTNKFARINNADTISTTTGTSGWFKTDNTSAYFAFDAEL